MKSSRHDIPNHFTASGVVIEQGHILLVHHKRIGAWVPPGGHIEPDELPEETVVREILEETGLSVAVIAQRWAPNDDPDAFFLPQPLFVQAVLAVEKGQRFYHVDMAYLCRCTESSTSGTLPALAKTPEVKESRWVKLTELETLPLAKNVSEILDLLPADVRQSALLSTP
jgi:8-oxo-dGTP diphosphatase